MSVATQLVVPGYDPESDEAFESQFSPGFGPDVAGVGTDGRRAHLRAVPLEAPGHARPVRRRAPSAVPLPGASVAVLLAPEPERLPVRLTRRGIVVLALLVAAVGAALVWVAALSAPADGAPGGHAGTAPAVVTVESGDTLWSIASRVAPDTDPRAEVDHLRRLNDLDGVALVPGQQLHVR